MYVYASKQASEIVDNQQKWLREYQQKTKVIHLHLTNSKKKENQREKKKCWNNY